MSTETGGNGDGSKGGGGGENKGKVLFRAALAFGIVAATIEMGVVLWMMYC